MFPISPGKQHSPLAAENILWICGSLKTVYGQFALCVLSTGTYTETNDSLHRSGVHMCVSLHMHVHPQ